jgi:hypothetical protein
VPALPTPTLQQARNQYARQKAVVAAGLTAIRRLFATNPKPTIPQIATTAGGYQLAAAAVGSRAVAGYADSTPETIAQAFMGVSSAGFSLTEPIIATIDRHVPAPVEPLPDPWWDDAQKFMADLEQLLLSEIQDAGRTASQVEFVSRPEWQNYVRMLTPPSCARCAILAGRIYRDIESFQRHPACDCVMVPVQDWQDAHDKGLVVSPDKAFENGDIRGLSKADAQAIADGADLQKVVNATRGIQTVDVFGRRVKATTEGTTKRAAWRKANPSRLVRLRPESIYQFANDREDAIRLLRLYGYIT